MITAVPVIKTHTYKTALPGGWCPDRCTVIIRDKNLLYRVCHYTVIFDTTHQIAKSPKRVQIRHRCENARTDNQLHSPVNFSNLAGSGIVATDKPTRDKSTSRPAPKHEALDTQSKEVSAPEFLQITERSIPKLY